MQKFPGMTDFYIGETVCIDIANRKAIGPFGASDITDDDWSRAARLDVQYGRCRYKYLSKLYETKQERDWKS